MKRAAELYDAYPDSPSGLAEWVRLVEGLYSDYKRKLGVS